MDLDSSTESGKAEPVPNMASSSPRANPTKTRILLGLADSAPVVEEHQGLNHHDYLWSRIRLALREPFAEFFGTFIMVMFGDGSVAQVLLSAGQTTSPGKSGSGAYQSISWGWGLGVMLGIYVAGDSGGFLNPAITFCFWIWRSDSSMGQEYRRKFD
ncbi:MAG: hypothetical protein Q9191_002217 [Dirinaria sp. TL-2023a]